MVLQIKCTIAYVACLVLAKMSCHEHTAGSFEGISEIKEIHDNCNLPLKFFEETETEPTAKRSKYNESTEELKSEILAKRTDGIATLPKSFFFR